MHSVISQQVITTSFKEIGKQILTKHGLKNLGIDQALPYLFSHEMAFLPLKWPLYCTITLLRQIFPSNNPENRDPSYETDLDFGVDLKGESPAINMIKAEKIWHKI